MQIEILHLIEGARQASGITVVIDVFRACSLACYMLDKGAVKIIPVGTVEKAYLYKRDHPGYLLIGERNNRTIPGFDFGNSPHGIKNEDFTGKTVIHTTSAGTQGIVNAVNADEILTGSFVNAGALIRYIAGKDPSHVSLVCMGYAARHPIEEDSLCAEYLKQKLEKHEPDFAAMVEDIRNTSGKRFFNPETQEYCPKEDFDLCLRLDAFDFVIKAERDEEFGIVLKKK
ncbi:MAG: 2-phosphosulfolactate phosphatase [Bacteroidales bacterium]|nr:2-phosphosulfolactate phosphatase [Bacteroidales bacterium]